MRNTSEFSLIKVRFFGFFLSLSMESQSMMNYGRLILFNILRFNLNEKSEREERKKKLIHIFSNADTFYEPDSWLSNKGKESGRWYR